MNVVEKITKYVTQVEFARLMGQSKQTIGFWMKSNKIPSAHMEKAIEVLSKLEKKGKLYPGQLNREYRKFRYHKDAKE